MIDYKIRELTKAHENKTIFVQGSGNNRNRNGVTPLLEATVVKVNRKNMVLKINNHEVNLRINGTTESHFNYDMYETLDHFKAQILISKIRDAMTYGETIEASKIIKASEHLGIESNFERYYQ